MATTSDVLVEEKVRLLLNDAGYRMAWLDDPVRNLCASVGIERTILEGLRPLTSAWRNQNERYNALVNALQRIVASWPKRDEGHVWVRVTAALDAPHSGQPYAWTIAVRLAVALGIVEVTKATEGEKSCGS